MSTKTNPTERLVQKEPSGAGKLPPALKEQVLQAPETGVRRRIIGGIDEGEVVPGRRRLGFASPHPPDRPPQGVGAFPLAEEPVGPGGHEFGERQEAERVARRRRVEDHPVPAPRSLVHEFGHPVHHGGLGGPGGLPRQPDLPFDLGVERRANEGAHGVTDPLQVAVGLGLGVDLEGGEGPDALPGRAPPAGPACLEDGRLLVPDSPVEEVAQGMGRVRGDQEHPLPPSSARRSPSAAAVVVFPTPPFPPTKRIGRRPTGIPPIASVTRPRQAGDLAPLQGAGHRHRKSSAWIVLEGGEGRKRGVACGRRKGGDAAARGRPGRRTRRQQQRM
jgi:hypothetical protein